MEGTAARGMLANGSSAFTDADGYQAGLRDMFDLLVLWPGEFHARLTWLELPSLYLLRAQESSSRVAFVTLPQAFVFVTFPRDRDARLICDGTELQFGDIMFHGPSDRFHQRTLGACDWGSVSVTPAFLKTAAMTVAGQVLAPPSIRQLLHPRRADHRRLLRLHAAAARMVETVPTHIGHREVIRAIEQDLILALVNCLTADEAKPVGRCGLRQPSKLAQFEAMLSAEPYRLLRTQDICEAIGMSARALRESCSRLLGMSPLRYQRLRRLKRVRAELMRRDGAVDVTEILARYGFPDLYGFVADYWNAFGELPPIPPRHAAGR